jgi:hypothetical protein
LVEPQDSLVRDTLLPRARLTLQPDVKYSIYLQLNQNKHGRSSFALIIPIPTYTMART